MADPGKPLRHVPVMLDEVVEGLSVRADGRYLDGTFGRGGHARMVLSKLDAQGCLLLMDRDPEAIAAARAAFADDPRVAVRQSNFSELAQWDAARVGLDGVLLDLGVSSPQLDDAARGFSFLHDAPLDMRMDPGSGQSAADYLAQASETDIATVLWEFGEERHARRIARAIVAERGRQAFERTTQLAALIERVVGWHEPGKHPATRSFQALRIQVNGELAALQAGLRAAVDCLRPGGRLAVISFHSLEDRSVKQFMRAESGRVQNRRRGPPVEAPVARLKVVGKARFPGADELRANPRSRSAVLRVAERLPPEVAA